MPDSPLRRALLGVEWTMTRRALLLAAAYFLVVAAGNVAALTAPEAFGIWWKVASFTFKFSDWHVLVDGGPGVVLVVGLALVQTALNEGYLPSLALATAPYYAYYLFTVDGPATGPVLAIHENLVVAPVWAAVHVVPNALAYGTLGFLLGLGVRRYRRRDDRDEPVPT